MKKSILSILAFSAIASVFVACSNKTEETPAPVVPKSTTVEVTGEIKSNKTWSADSIYLLKGFVFVSNNATLTIQPGTIIKGDKASKGTLIITRGAKIQAAGTVDKPIVFTSALASGGRAQGDWGGLIILGKAPVNQGADVKIEGGLTAPAGVASETPYIFYGGTDAADNSGTLRYVRIEYAGIAFSPDNEINGLTMGGVGSGTTLEYIEVYRSGDDAYEWFGGSVNAKYLMAIGTWDDDFDTDFGYSGKVQFGLIQRAQVIADFSGSNGFESDNNATGTAATPQTNAIFSNITLVGPLLNVTSTSNINANFQNAVQIRRNSSISIFNSLITNYTEGVFIDDALPAAGNNASANFTSGSLVVKNNLVFGCNVRSNEVKGLNATSKAIFETGLRASNTFDAAKSATDLLTDPLKYGTDFKATGNANLGTPNFTLKAASVAAAGGVFTDAKFTGDTFFNRTIAYLGGFGTTDWTSGWASYDPQLLPYTTPGAVK